MLERKKLMKRNPNPPQLRWLYAIENKIYIMLTIIVDPSYHCYEKIQLREPKTNYVTFVIQSFIITIINKIDHQTRKKINHPELQITHQTDVLYQES